MAPLTPSLSSSATNLSKPVIIDDEKRTDSEIGSSSKSSIHDKEAEEDGAALGHKLSHIDTSDYPTKFPLVMIVVALCLAVFMMALDMTIVATAIPKITDQFKSLDQVGWYESGDVILDLSLTRSQVRVSILLDRRRFSKYLGKGIVSLAMLSG